MDANARHGSRKPTKLESALVGVYLVALLTLGVFGIFYSWPMAPADADTDGGQVAVTEETQASGGDIGQPAPGEQVPNGDDNAGGDEASAAANDTLWRGDEKQLLVLAIAGGLLGATLAALVPFTFYHGIGAFKVSWMPEYVMRPLVGAVVALILYAGIRGGLLRVSTELDAVNALNPYAVVAVTAFGGYCSRQVLHRLRQTLAKGTLPNAGKTPGADGAAPS